MRQLDPPGPLDDREPRALQRRLFWGASSLALVVLLMLVGESAATAHPLMVTGNLTLLVASLAVAVRCRRTGVSATVSHALGAGLAALTLAMSLGAFVIEPNFRFTVMVIVQMVGASLLFVSTAWLVAYVAVAATAAVAVTVALGRTDESTLVGACAVLAVTVHVALRDRQRHADRAHADELATALALSRRQLEAKEQAEQARAVAEREREGLQAQLLHVQKMEAIGTLAGGVAHDMNNALAAILGFAECIQADTDSPEIRADAEEILLAANRAAELTRNLLGFGRRGTFQRVSTRPESVITSLVTLLTRTLPKGIRVETSFADQLAAVEVDASALTHALVNLGINASDAMEGHGVLTVGARLEPVDGERARVLGLEPGPHVVIFVRDTGHGMDEAVRARIFEPFFTTKAQGKGTGLGLAMVYGTVKRHRGAIHVVSAPGAGSTFEIYLPASTAPVLTPVVEMRTTAEVPIRRGGRILVIDDEEMVRTIMVRTLERAGYAVSVAVNGQAGLEALGAAARPDLVILDMAMPVMAGPETFRRARARDPELKVLLASGYTSSEDAQGLLDEGALGLIEKPFTPSRLLAAVERASRGRRLDQTAPGLAADRLS